MNSNVILKIIFSYAALCSTRNYGISVSTVGPTINGIYIPDIAEQKLWHCFTNASCTTPRSFCNDQKFCQCPRDYTFNAAMTACIEVALGYGISCTETAQCVSYLEAGGICINGVCSCATGYHYFAGFCKKSSGLGEKCSIDILCNVNGDFEALTCDNGFCRCRDNFYQREYRTCRRRAEGIGADCTIDLDCTFNKNARCDKRSGCYLDYDGTINDNEDEVTNIVSLDLQDNRERYANTGIQCTTSDECLQYQAIRCSDLGHCICLHGYGFDSKIQLCVPELGTWCMAGDSPRISNAICRDDYWSCAGPRVPSKNNFACLKATTKFNTSCQVDEQCYVFGPDSLCVDNRCICNENSHYVEEDMFCWINRGINEMCKQNKDCYMNNFDSKLHCNEMAKCACPAGSHVNSAQTFCVQDTPVLGDRCSADIDCEPLSNTQCYNGSCQCTDDYFNLSGVCVAGINASCICSFDCKAEKSICQSTICRCIRGFVSPSSDLCVPVSPFGGGCQYNIQCSSSIPNAICSRPEVTDRNQSATAESISSSIGICNCAEGYHLNVDKCYKKKVLGQKCYSQGECYVTSDPDSVRCLKGICDCNSDARYINSTFCDNDGSTTILFSSWLILPLIFVIDIM